MFRVIAARSLKFSEHRDDHNTKMSDGEVSVKKRHEIYKTKGAGKDRSANNVANQYSAADKLRTPSVVAEIIQRECKKKKKERRGVWSSMGQVYRAHEMPDLDLGDGKNVTELKRKVRKNQMVDVKNTDVMGSRQQLEKLVKNFMSTKEKLLNVNLFNSDPLKAQASGGGGGGNNNSLLSNESGSNNNGNSHQSPSKIESKEVRWEDLKSKDRLNLQWNNAAKNKYTSALRHEHNAAHRAVNNQNTANRYLDARKPPSERWRKQREKLKDEGIDKLRIALIARKQDMDQVYANPQMYNRALRIVGMKRQTASQLSSSSLKYKKVMKKSRSTIWAKTKMLSDQDTMSDPLALPSDKPSKKKKHVRKISYNMEKVPVSRVTSGSSYSQNNTGFPSNRSSFSLQSGRRSMAASASVPVLTSGRRQQLDSLSNDY